MDTNWLLTEGLAFLQIMWLNIVLSGDNAVVIGMAAASLPAHQRKKAVLFGIIAAAVLRVVFSVLATYLLNLWELTIVGGLLLLWISYSFLADLRKDEAEEEEHKPHEQKTLFRALTQIIIADVSMSLDNVLAVAGIAKDNMPMLVIGLLVSIVLIGVAGNFLAGLLKRYKFIGWAGLALIFWVAVKLLFEGLEHGNEAMGYHYPIPSPETASLTATAVLLVYFAYEYVRHRRATHAAG